MLLARIAVVVGLSILGAASPSLAQESTTPAPPSVPTPNPLDIVVMKDGGIVRGTISELRPDDSVSIVLLTGESRTIPMSEVQYAGPESERPHGGTEPPAEHDAAPTSRSIQIDLREARRSVEVPFAFRSTPAGVTLMVYSGSASVTSYGRSPSGGTIAINGTADSYSTLCTAPCNGRIRPGVHRLALVHGKGEAIEPAYPTRVDGASTLHGQVVSRKGTRLVGGLIAVGSAVLGTWLVLSAPDAEPGDDGIADGVARVAAGCAGVVFGLVLMGTRDQAVIAVSPATTGRIWPSRQFPARDVAQDSAWPAGFEIRGTL